MADEKIVIEVVQRFRNENWRGGIDALTDYAKNLRGVTTEQQHHSEITQDNLRVLKAIRPELEATTRSWSRYARELNRTGSLSRRQVENFAKVDDALRQMIGSLSDAEKEVAGFGRATAQAASAHQTATQKIVRNQNDIKKVMRESRNFTDANTGAVRRLAREVDRYTATTGRRAISGFREWATTILSIIPSAVPAALSVLSNAITTVAGAAVEGAASLRDFAGGVGVAGAALTAGIQIMGAFKLGLTNIGQSSQSLGKVISGALSESGEQFLTILKQLPPQAREFAITVRTEVFPMLHEWRREMQNVFFSSLSEGFRNIKPLLEPVHGALLGMGRAMGEVIRSVSKELGRREWQEFVKFQGGENVRNFQVLTTALIPLANAFRELTTAAAPVTRFLTDAAAHALKSFAAFVHVRVATGALARDADRARTSLHTMGQTLGNLFHILMNVTKAAQPFGRELLESFQKNTAAAKQWTASFEGQERITQFFKDIRPAIYETMNLFRDLGAVMIKQTANPGLFETLHALRTQILPALQKVMDSVMQGGQGITIIQLLTNSLQVLANVMAPNGPGGVMLTFLNDFVNLLSKITDNSVARAAVGIISFWRIFRLIGGLKVTRLAADWLGWSEKVASAVQRGDAAIVRAKTATEQFSDHQAHFLRRVAAEWKGMGAVVRAETEKMRAAIRLAQETGQTAAASTMFPAGFRGAFVDNPNARFRDEVDAGTATRRQNRAYMRDVGVTHVQTDAGWIPRGQLHALDAQVAARKILDMELAAAIERDAAVAARAAAVAGETTKTVLKEAGVVAAKTVAASVATVAIAAGRQAAIAAEMAGRQAGVVVQAGRGVVPVAPYQKFKPAVQRMYESPYAMYQRSRFSSIRDEFRTGRADGGIRGGLRGAARESFRGSTGVGLGFGLPIAATLAGQAIGGRAGSALTGIGTGAGLGFAVAGPWGALAGGLAGAVASLGLFRRGVDKTSEAIKAASDKIARADAEIPGLKTGVAQAGLNIRAAGRERTRTRTDLRNYLQDTALRTGMSADEVKKTSGYKRMLDDVTQANINYTNSLRELAHVTHQLHVREKERVEGFQSGYKRVAKEVKSAREGIDKILSGPDRYRQNLPSALKEYEKTLGKIAVDLAKKNPGAAKYALTVQRLIDQLQRVPTPKEIQLTLNTDTAYQQLAGLYRSLGLDGKARQAGREAAQARIPARGIIQARRRGGYLVPGERVAADNVLIAASPGEAVLTDDGQQMIQRHAPGLLEEVIRSQSPHFRAGGWVRGYAAGGRVRPDDRAGPFGAGPSAPIGSYIPPSLSGTAIRELSVTEQTSRILPNRLPGSLFRGANAAFLSGFQSTAGTSAREDFISGILSRGFFSTPDGKGSPGLIPPDAPPSVRNALRAMLNRANTIARNAGPLVQVGNQGSPREAATQLASDYGISFAEAMRRIRVIRNGDMRAKVTPDASGHIRGLEAKTGKVIRGYTIASAMAAVLRAGGFNVPMVTETKEMSKFGPRTGAGKYLTMHYAPGSGGADVALELLNRFFGLRIRSNEATGNQSGLGWVSAGPDGAHKRHWPNFRRGGRVPGFAGGGLVGRIGHRVADLGRYAWRDNTGEAYSGMGLKSFLTDTAHGFDPRTRSGLLNLASFAMPGRTSAGERAGLSSATRQGLTEHTQWGVTDIGAAAAARARQASAVRRTFEEPTQWGGAAARAAAAKAIRSGLESHTRWGGPHARGGWVGRAAHWAASAPRRAVDWVRDYDPTKGSPGRDARIALRQRREREAATAQQAAALYGHRPAWARRLQAPLFSVPGDQPGLISQGNIDLAWRKIARNKDGSISTVSSMTVGIDGGRALVLPTVINGRSRSQSFALAHYRRTGDNLGMFSSETAATRYSHALHRQQARMYRGSFRRGGVVGRYAAGGIISRIAQPGRGTASNVAFNNAIVELNSSIGAMSEAGLAGLRDQFRSMVEQVQSRLRAALSRGDRKGAIILDRQLTRLQVGLQAVEFGVGERIAAIVKHVTDSMDAIGRLDQTSIGGISKAISGTQQNIQTYRATIARMIKEGLPQEAIDTVKQNVQQLQDSVKQQVGQRFQLRIDEIGRTIDNAGRLDSSSSGGLARATKVTAASIRRYQGIVAEMVKAGQPADAIRNAQQGIQQLRDTMKEQLGQKLQQRIDAINRTMEGVGRIDQSSLGGVRRAMKITSGSIKQFQQTVIEMMKAGRPLEEIRNAREGILQLRQARREQLRQRFQLPIDNAQFKTSRAQAALEGLSIRQQLKGVSEATAGQEQADLIRKRIIPDLRKEQQAMQEQLNNKVSRRLLTNQERQQAQLAIDQKGNEIAQAQLDAMNAVKKNTSNMVQKLAGNLAFEYGGQRFTDLIGAETGAS